MIDCHTHAPGGSGWLAGATFTADDMLAVMDRVGIETAAVFTFDGLAHPSPAENDRTAAFVERSERLIAFTTVDPRRADAADEVHRCVAQHGMVGIKLHPWLQGFCVHDPYMDPVCKAAAVLGIPILFHDGTPPYSMALQIAVLARRHPRVPMVLGHAGLHDTWREALAALHASPNVWACICGTPPYAARRILADGPPDRIVFGTDSGLSKVVEQPYVAQRVREVLSYLSAAERRAVLEDNPLRLLDLA